MHRLIPYPLRLCVFAETRAFNVDFYCHNQNFSRNDAKVRSQFYPSVIFIRVSAGQQASWDALRELFD